MRHGYDPPPVREQRQPSRVSAYLSSLLGDDYKYPAPPDKFASFSDDLHEEFDAGPEDLPELDESSDDEESPTDARSAASAKASEAERPIHQPDRYTEIPAVTFTRPGALGPGHPPYALLLSLPPEVGKNRIVLFDIGYYEARRVKGGYKCFLIGADYRSSNVYYKPLRSKSEIPNAYAQIALENNWPKCDHIVHVVSDGEPALVKGLREGCTRMGQSFSTLPPESPNTNFGGSNAMKHIRAMVRAYLVDASRFGKVVDSSFESLAWAHAVQVRNCIGLPNHKQHFSPYRIHFGVAPIWDFVPWCTGGYITKSPESGRLHDDRGGQPGARRAEPCLILGRKDVFSRFPQVLTTRNTLRSGLGVYIDLSSPPGVFPGTVVPAEVLASPSTVPASVSPEPDASMTPVSQAVHDKVAALEQQIESDRRCTKLQRASVRLLTAYDESQRIVRHEECSPSRAPYINRRIDELVGKTVAEALQLRYLDDKGRERRYSREDLDYDVKARRIRIQFTGSSEDVPQAEEAYMACMSALAGSDSAAEFQAEDDLQARINHLVALVQVAAMKDLDWKEHLRGPHAAAVKAAFHKEMASLASCKAAYRVLPDSPEYAEAVKNSTLCRVLLDLKRNNEWKARCVLQGFRQDRVKADGPEFTYYAAVARLSTVRLTTLRPGRNVPRPGRSGVRQISTRDVSTAFLQSDPFPETDRRYLKVVNPIDGSIEYWRQLRPLYGEGSAPARWAKTLADWLTTPESAGGPGLVRGKNEPTVFYHPTRDLLVVVYVDDLLCDSFAQEISWFYDLLDKRFTCKPPQYLTETNPIDYLGCTLFMTKSVIGISMQSYIENMAVALNMENVKAHPVPFAADITNFAPLEERRHAWFRSALGMVGWLTSTTRCDARFAHSRISQHTAQPTVGAYDALYKLVRYLIGTKSWCIVQDLHTDGAWQVYSDADLCSNGEPQCKRRSQLGYVVTVNNCPIMWQSKCSTVQFWESAFPAGFSELKPVTANPRLLDEHADFSSAAAEIYAVANCVNDVIALSYVCEEAGIPFQLPFTIHIDNQAAISYMTRRDFAGRTKLRHIDARACWVEALRDAQIVAPRYIPTESQLADWMTKGLVEHKFIRFRNKLMLNVPLLFKSK